MHRCLVCPGNQNELSGGSLVSMTLCWDHIKGPKISISPPSSSCLGFHIIWASRFWFYPSPRSLSIPLDRRRVLVVCAIVVQFSLPGFDYPGVCFPFFFSTAVDRKKKQNNPFFLSFSSVGVRITFSLLWFYFLQFFFLFVLPKCLLTWKARLRDLFCFQRVRKSDVRNSIVFVSTDNCFLNLRLVQSLYCVYVVRLQDYPRFRGQKKVPDLIRRKLVCALGSSLQHRDGHDEIGEAL